MLKQAWPGFVTGKLSDVAGLVIAPLVLAVPLAALRVRRCDVTSYIRSDPSDLLALPALLVALRVHRLAGRARPLLRERALVTAGAVVLPFAVLATAATSPCDDGVRHPSVAVMEGAWADGAGGWERGRRVVHGEELVLRPETGVSHVRRLAEQEARRIDEDRVAGLDRAACDPQRPNLCWRTDDRDGVATDPTQVDSLAVQHPVVMVSIANGGLAIRDASGTWTRYSDENLAQRADAVAPGEPDQRATTPHWERRHPIRELEVVEPIDPGRHAGAQPDPAAHAEAAVRRPGARDGDPGP